MPYPSPRVILLTLLTLAVGALSLGFNPLFVPSIAALGAGVASVRSARTIESVSARGILLALAVVGIMAALDGIAVAVRLILLKG